MTSVFPPCPLRGKCTESSRAGCSTGGCSTGPCSHRTQDLGHYPYKCTTSAEKNTKLKFEKNMGRIKCTRSDGEREVGIRHEVKGAMNAKRGLRSSARTVLLHDPFTTKSDQFQISSAKI